jgi:hypothetical protein
MLQMMCGDLTDLAAGGLFRAAEAQKGADFVEREAKLTRAPDEHKDAKVV